MRISNGVMFEDKHSYHDFGLIMTNKEISSPVPQTKLVSIPGRNGSVDMSAVVSDTIKYEDRTITMTFYSPKKVDGWPQFTSSLRNYLAGNQMKLIFDDDIAFYWLGRITDVSFSVSGPNATIKITATVAPYKYTIQSSAEDWLWDPFDFEQSVINDFVNLEVNGSLTVSIIGEKKYVNPVITSDAAMTVMYEGASYNINPGSQVMYDIVLTKQEDILEFSGTGTVSINYIGGSL